MSHGLKQTDWSSEKAMTFCGKMAFRCNWTTALSRVTCRECQDAIAAQSLTPSLDK